MRSLVALEVAVVVTAFVLPLIVAAHSKELPPPVQISLAGKGQVLVNSGATLGRLLKGLGLKPHSGSLLDVEGKILERHAYPGSVTVNGQRVPRRTVLAQGDVIQVVNRPDQTEPLLRQVVKLPGRQPENPEFYLGTVPGEEIVTTGKISDKLVSSVFRATGPIHQPRSVALTFDDGPNPPYTQRILAVLKRHHVHATFFTIGYLAARYPDLVKREHRMGMVVADHSWNHPTSPPLKDLPPTVISSEISRAADALSAAGVSTRFFRPPGGSTSPEVEELAKELGMRVVLWSVDPKDWRNGIRTKQIVKNVLADVRPGSIVLMHDGGGNQSATVRALPKIIKGIRKKHLELVTIT
jgi:peptidoglycan/xylan/chitin deacetylase (PgdA/CDA1 family)/sulfur carrier protein ThiS